MCRLGANFRRRASISSPLTDAPSADRKGKKRAAREPTPDPDRDGRASSPKRVKPTPAYELRSKEGSSKGKAKAKKTRMPKKAA